MKSLLLIIILLATSSGFAQDSIHVTKVNPPRLVTKLQLGKSYQLGNLDFKFAEVLQDSRCPKNVNCIWAGEVVISIDVFENGNKINQKKLSISAKSYIQNLLGNLFKSEGLTVSVFNVLPYPVSGKKTKLEDYYIQLDIRKVIE